MKTIVKHLLVAAAIGSACSAQAQLLGRGGVGGMIGGTGSLGGQLNGMGNFPSRGIPVENITSRADANGNGHGAGKAGAVKAPAAKESEAPATGGNAMRGLTGQGAAQGNANANANSGADGLLGGAVQTSRDTGTPLRDGARSQVADSRSYAQSTRGNTAAAGKGSKQALVNGASAAKADPSANANANAGGNADGSATK